MFEKYEIILENLLDGFLILDKKGKILMTNTSYCKMSGYTKEEILSMNIIEMDYKDSVEIVKKRINNVLKDNYLKFETLHKKKDGSMYPVYVSVNKITENNEEYLISSVRDITTDKAIRKKLIKNEKLFQNMLKVIPDMISIHDNDMNILYSNWNGFANIAKEKRILNTKCYKTYRGYYDICPDCQAKKVINKSEKIHMEVELPEGIWIELQVIPILDENNKCEMFVEWVKDITERKKDEKELIKSKEEAEIANKAKSEFLANMSHEIRTPMNGVIGMSELLSQTELNENQKKYLEFIQISADNLLAIINDILNISKLESGKVELEIKELELEKMMNNILALLSVNAHKKGIEVVYYIDKDIPEFLEGDEVKLNQILINLIGNAVKFTDKGEILIEIKKINQEDDFYEIEFSVKDTGIGMSVDILKNLFKPFVQGDLSYTKKYQGTGLGLAISKQLLEIMGGKIFVKSDIGKGSKFSFNLKLKKSNRLIHNISDLDVNLKNLKILFIDDNELNREITQKMLSDEGIEVLLAESGEKGLEILKNNLNIDMILLDVHMPLIDGIETLKLIKEKYNDKYEILMFTSVDLRDKVSTIKKFGAKDYIIKPVTRKDLIKKIKNILNCKVEKEIEEDLNEIKNIKKSNKTILIIEDNFINMEVAKIMISKIGNYNIYFASNGKEALEIYKKNKIDIIFLDIQMPIMNGIEAYNEIIKISEIENRKRPKIIAMTAYAMDTDKEKYLNMGMDYFLSKPFKVKNIKEILELEFDK